MPSRIIRDSYPDSRSVAACPGPAQDRMPRYWLAADDFGCFTADPTVLRGRLFPLRDDVTADVIASDLSAYATAGMIELWSDRERLYGFWRSWHRHQRPRPGAKAKTPTPPSVVAAGGWRPYWSASADRTPDSLHLSCHEAGFSAASAKKNGKNGTAGTHFEVLELFSPQLAATRRNSPRVAATRARAAATAAAVVPNSVGTASLGLSEGTAADRQEPECESADLQANPPQVAAERRPSGLDRLVVAWQNGYRWKYDRDPAPLPGQGRAVLARVIRERRPPDCPTARWIPVLEQAIGPKGYFGDSRLFLHEQRHAVRFFAEDLDKYLACVDYEAQEPSATGAATPPATGSETEAPAASAHAPGALP